MPNVIYTTEGDRVSLYPTLEELLVQDDIGEEFTDNKKITMVGSYTFSDGSLWYSFPKYYKLQIENEKPSVEDMHHMQVLIRVLEKLRGSGKNLKEGDRVFDGYSIGKSAQRVNLLDLASFIIKDYIQYGLYKQRIDSYGIAQIGKTNWSKTIKKISPIIREETIVYPQTIKKRTHTDQQNLISRIHSVIVNQALHVYEKINGIVDIESPQIDYYDSSEDIARYVPFLNQVLLTTYGDRDSMLIKAMIAWCGESLNYKMAGCTNCFPNVWEWVNDEVFGNQRRKESQRPDYVFFDKTGQETKYIGTGTAKPDTLFFEYDQPSDRYWLYVYDAKYYIPSLSVLKSPKEVYGYPPNSDIVKQVAYLKNM